MQIRRAKPEAKAYTFGDGLGLSLLIEPNGSKSWRFRYRYAGKPKMISLGVYPTITLADARSRRDEARKLVAEGKNPSEVRKEQKLAMQTESENAFEKIATESGINLNLLNGRRDMHQTSWKRLRTTFFLMSEQGLWERLNR